MDVDILRITCLIEVFLFLYWFARIEWAYKKCVLAIYGGYYNDTVGYKKIVDGHGFWRWDIEYFMKN